MVRSSSSTKPVGTPRDIPLADVMKREQTLIPVDMDQEEVALRFQKYALISAAVVDASGRALTFALMSNDRPPEVARPALDAVASALRSCGCT